MTAGFSLSAHQPTLTFQANAQRILALHFPHLPTDRISRKKWGLAWRLRNRPETSPIVCSGRHANTMRPTALDEAAEAINLKRNMGVAEACAIHPTIEVIEEDSAADLRFEGIAGLVRPLYAAGGARRQGWAVSRHHRLRPSLRRRKGAAPGYPVQALSMGIDVRGAITSPRPVLGGQPLRPGRRDRRGRDGTGRRPSSGRSTSLGRYGHSPHEDGAEVYWRPDGNSGRAADPPFRRKRAVAALTRCLNGRGADIAASACRQPLGRCRLMNRSRRKKRFSP